MNRRRSILAIGAALAAGELPVRAQARAASRVGFLSSGSKADAAAYLASFMEGLRALGYREGDNLSLEARHADYSESQVGRMAAEIAALKPAVIVAFGGGIVPAIRLSPPIPVVFLHSGDPVDGGFAESLARPGDLPIELPTVVELVVNRRTAAAMNLVLPPAILSRADRVVDSQAAT